MSDMYNSNTSTNYSGESGRISIKPNDILIENISSILISLIEENKNLKNYKEKILLQKKLIFESPEIPPISIKDYLFRIQSFSEVEDSTLIVSLIYIDKICDTASIILSEYNVHRILFMSILMALKYNEDMFYDNKYYSKIAGVPLKELKKMEYEYIKLVNFDLYVNKAIFEKYKKYINSINSIKNKTLEDDITFY